MTPEQKKAAEYAEILLAFSRGVKLQYKSKVINQWCPVDNGSLPLDYPNYEYRIAPKPVERWGYCDAHGRFMTTDDAEHHPKEKAAECGGRHFLMREVTE